MIKITINGTAALKKLANYPTIIPAYTCDTVQKAFNKVICGYADIELDTYGVDFTSLKHVINSTNPKAVVLQHLHGFVARDYIKCVNFLKEKGIIIIEDCTQSWGATYRGYPVGSLGDYAVFSFNRYKVISLGIGGILQQNPHNLKHYDPFSVIKKRKFSALLWTTKVISSNRNISLPTVIKLSTPSYCWFPIRIKDRESIYWPPRTRYGFDSLSDLPNSIKASNELVLLSTSLPSKKIVKFNI